MECTDRAPIATFFVSDALVAGGTVTLPEEAAHHIRVARIAVGECIALRDGAGKAALGTLVKVSRSSALVDVTETSEMSRSGPIHLLAPVADRDRMLWLAEKATELGVTSWRPVVWRRSKSVSPRGEGSMFQAKVRARMTSALIQSGGGWLPDIFPEATIERAVAAAPLGTRLLLARDGEPIVGVPMKTPITIALGPEGGMEPAERDAFIGAAFLPVKLGESTLRFETAGVAAVAIAAASLALSRQSNG
ncbi:MAG: 16S rRNA (uracil(1498)-N(3))-methyltransferase [Gemmatimonadota bacterium]|nr:16S rRNA (uracil(1498)-N(3))-methyltransferase [Gemmatimonadota bacterium]